MSGIVADFVHWRHPLTSGMHDSKRVRAAADILDVTRNYSREQTRRRSC